MSGLYIHMSKFQCKKCLKTFDLSNGYKRHMNKKYDCKVKLPSDIEPKCEFCNKTYANKYVLYKHKLKCKAKNNTDTQIKLLTNKIEQMEKTINNMSDSKNIKTMSNNLIQTNSNIVNNISVQLLPFDKTNNYLNDLQITKILNHGYRSVEECIKKLHFDIAHPENHNIYISNNRDKHVNVYDGTNWNLQEKNELVEQLYTSNTDFLIDKFEKLLDDLDKATINKFTRFKTDTESNGDLDNIKENIKLLLYNNRALIANTKKQQQLRTLLLNQ